MKEQSVARATLQTSYMGVLPLYLHRYRLYGPRLTERIDPFGLISLSHSQSVT